ncbi:MAG TPA: serine/threonine-protein kinase [Polyangiaceae bacterium]
MNTAAASSHVIGRYAIYDEIASGGMATVHLGRLQGSVGFSRTVAIKRLHAHLAKDTEFVKMFLDEARVAARIRHRNVVPTLDVVNADGQLFLVMEYVQGESLARLVRMVRQRGERIAVAIAGAITVGILQGLHAAHEATSDSGEKLGIVHRDVSPQNVMIGRDGVARVLDFGVAKASGRLQTTRDGQLKGKLGYLPPDFIRGGPVTRAIDVYAASVVLWELLAGQRLFSGENDASVLERVLFGEVVPPSRLNAHVPRALDDAVLRGLSRDPAQRFPSAREMARAIEGAIPIATSSDLGEWVEGLAGATLDERQRKVTEIETGSDVHPRPQLGEIVVSMPDGSAAAQDPADGTDASASELRPRSERTPWSRRAVVAGLVASAVLGVFLLARRHGPAAPSPTSAESVDPAAVLAPAPPAPPASAPATPAAPAVEPPAPPSATPVVSAVTKPAPARRPGGGPRPKAGCAPPYTIGPDGVKQYKLECL